MTRSVRLFMFFELAAFTVAALIHFGLLIDGYAHQKAGTAESVIALVLVVGLAATWIRPGSTREIGLAAQGFALLGTLVGIFTIAIGVGPRTAPDIVYHIGILVVLGSGLVVAVRARQILQEAGHRERLAITELLHLAHHRRPLRPLEPVELLLPCQVADHPRDRIDRAEAPRRLFGRDGLEPADPFAAGEPELRHERMWHVRALP